MAEYEACILGIRMAFDMNIKELLIIGDFDLLIHQVQGEWSTKNVKILPYLHYVKELCKKFTKIEFRFGILESIITNNAANLNSDLIREIYEKFRIVHSNFPAYRPQMNEAVKAANKNIKRILRKIVDNHRKWYEKLPFALLGYRTIMRASTGVTPYVLVYDTKAVIPTEVQIPSVRVIQEEKLDDEEWIRVRQEQLILIEEKRMDAEQTLQCGTAS
ncbi:uncharacterized protein [Nicotiana tomentosiformis]|uniref:uncharacterized protein n=1 Tax=Nicotiana tomentosiformis TaxID=4098 RepID=UPI00388C905B